MVKIIPLSLTPEELQRWRKDWEAMDHGFDWPPALLVMPPDIAGATATANYASAVAADAFYKESRPC